VWVSALDRGAGAKKNCNIELGVVGAFARGGHDAGIAQFCLLSAVGSSAIYPVIPRNLAVIETC
jgi:hypothetical protein